MIVAGFRKYSFTILLRPCSVRVSLTVPWLVLAPFGLTFGSLLAPFWFPFGSFCFPVGFLGSLNRVHANSAVAGPRLCRAKDR